MNQAAQIAPDQVTSNADVLLLLSAVCFIMMLLIIGYVIEVVFRNRSTTQKLPGGKPDGWRRTSSSMVPFEPIYDDLILERSEGNPPTDRLPNDKFTSSVDAAGRYDLIGIPPHDSWRARVNAGERQ
jgi:hypothetical protein